MPPITLLSHGFQAEYEIGFANGLAHNGADVLLLGSDKTLRSRLVKSVQLLNLRGSQDSGRPRFIKLFNLLRYIGSYLVFLVRTRGRVVHVNGLFSTRSSLVSLLEAWLTRICAGAYFLTVHDVLPHDADTFFNRRIYRMLYGAPGTLVVHTQRVADRLTNEFGVDRRRIVVIEHGIDRFFVPEPALRASFRTVRFIPETARVALLFGQIMRYKGVDLLLDAFRQMGSDDPLHLVIVGKCFDAELLQELHQTIAAHPCRARIHWDNRFIPEAEIPAVMAGADFVVLPYRRIDQSGVLFMALSTGLPLVVSDVGALAAYVPPEVGETVIPENADALAAAMLRLTTRLATLSRDEIIAYAQRFAWKNTVQPLLERYGAGAAPAWHQAH